MNKQGKAITAIALAAAMVLSLSACAGDSPDTSSSQESSSEIQTGGVAKVASFFEMVGFDPVRLANVGTGVERAAQVMDTLLRRNDLTDEVTGQLAKGISSEDGITWVLELREGVTFTDGTPLDAEAVIFNLERHIAPDSKSFAKAVLSGITAMEATGEYEVTFTLAAPNGSFPLALTGSSPASLIGSPAALADPEAFNSNPVGAGPFVFDSWVRDNELTLTRNADYWDEGKPYLEGLEYKILVDDDTRADDLASGGSDLALVLANRWNTMSADPQIDLQPVPTGGQALIPNGSRAPGNDERVRKAISMSLDGTVSANVLFGGTQVWDGNTECIPFPKGSPACVPGAVNEQDIEEAKELVQSYIDDGGDPAVDLVYESTLANQGQYYQQQLTEIGLEVTPRNLDIAGYTQAQSSGDYGIFVGSTASTGFPTVWNRYYSEGTNWGMVAYPELDEALLRARDSLELSERTSAWQDVTTFIHDNSILSWTSPYGAAMAHQKRLHIGSAEHPYEGSTMVYLHDAWLEQ